MRISERGILNAGEPGTCRAVTTFPSVTTLAGGTLLATYRVGSGKDSIDERIEQRRSADGGRNWTAPQSPEVPRIDGLAGSLKLAYVTALDARHLLMAAMWVDRQTYPGMPLFNERTEGCLPMRIVLADSHDAGATWSPWRVVPLPDDVGPPSLTSPVLRLPSGRLVLSIETNKHYEDTGTWHQRVVYVRSEDGGRTWGRPRTTTQDPTARIFNWDQRVALAPDGRLVTFTWTYDRQTTRYLNIHRRVSRDEGETWSAAEDLGIADQPSRPAILPDGRVVLAWVDRFGSRSIRARLAEGLEFPFQSDSEVTLYRVDADPTTTAAGGGNTGELLAEMGVWSFGLPYAEPLPDGDVLVTYYAGEASAMQSHWGRLAL